MYEDFFVERLIELRRKQDVSAQDMSLSLGYSSSYINKIENKKAFPTMKAFFYICEYLKISPSDFFYDNNLPLDQKDKLKETTEDLKLLKTEELNSICAIIISLIG